MRAHGLVLLIATLLITGCSSGAKRNAKPNRATSIQNEIQNLANKNGEQVKQGLRELGEEARPALSQATNDRNPVIQNDVLDLLAALDQPLATARVESAPDEPVIRVSSQNNWGGKDVVLEWSWGGTVRYRERGQQKEVQLSSEAHAELLKALVNSGAAHLETSSLLRGHKAAPIGDTTTYLVSIHFPWSENTLKLDYRYRSAVTVEPAPNGVIQRVDTIVSRLIPFTLPEGE